MSVAGFPSEQQTSGRAALAQLAALRTRAGVAIGASAADGETRLAHLSEFGGYRAKFPDRREPAVEAAILNTGGGVVGGDRVAFEMRAGPSARLTVGTATAERIYRSTGAAAEISITLDAAPAARLAWLPQATILFSGARLVRRFEVDIAADAHLLIAEATVFGRVASGEIMGDGFLRDTWRVRRDGRLIFAEASRLDGDIGRLLARPAVAGTARTAALLLAAAPGIEARIDAVRAAVAGVDALAGVSAWDGKLVLRALSSTHEPLQTVLHRAVAALGGFAVPQTWPT